MRYGVGQVFKAPDSGFHAPDKRGFFVPFWPGVDGYNTRKGKKSTVLSAVLSTRSPFKKAPPQITD